jgi:hypothetical protein
MKKQRNIVKKIKGEKIKKKKKSLLKTKVTTNKGKKNPMKKPSHSLNPHPSPHLENIITRVLLN